MNFIRKLIGSHLARVLGASALMTLFRMILGLVSTKVIALFAGPAGVAAMGQLSSFLALSGTISGAGISPGVVKYVSQFHEDEVVRRRIYGSALALTAVFASTTLLVCVIFRNQISTFLFGTDSYGYLVLLGSIAGFATAFGGTVQAVLNGLMMIGRMLALSLAGMLISFCIMLPLVITYGVEGALAAVCLGSILGALFSIVFTFSSKWLVLADFFHGIDKKFVRLLTNFTLMALVAGTVSPVAMMIIRSWLTSTFSPSDAGLWQSMWRISDLYIQLVTISIGTYFVPRLSRAKDDGEVRDVIIRSTSVLVPITAAAAAIIYVCRDLIILVLYTDSFSNMRDLFLFQLIGDVLKIASWQISTIMVARAMTRLFIISDILFNVMFVCLLIFLSDMYGLVGTSYAFAASYFLYLVFIIVSFRRLLFPGVKGHAAT